MSLFIEDQKKLLRNYITSPDVFLKQSDLKIISRTPNINTLLNVTKCPASTTLKAKRDYLTGEILDFVEKVVTHADANAKNSMSFKRAPAPNESIRGNPMNFPFWPGGFDEPTTELVGFYGSDVDFDDEHRLTIPPGFEKGYTFEDKTSVANNGENMVDLLTALEKDFELSEWLDSNEGMRRASNEENKEPVILHTTQEDESLLETVKATQILQISQCPSGRLFASQWAEIIDTTKPVVNFKEKVHDMAMTFDFELDIFQKQAIMKLEEHEYVFVAAHTSAGKTVIAEYAIALSMKHSTKVIYTSPIKALSNQKYREFQKFKDVGLLTGDWQIKPDASCIIMTTEILRSMLFNGTEIARELEYVIFDEIHYINDPDRGHVWEEVMMLLPDTVNIIMLSATVSNFIELAEWVGMIKKRKVYVITTLKRPIPLEHYLYLDSGGKKKENMHLIVDSNNKFRVETYNQLKTEFEEKKTKGGPPNNQKEAQRKWNHLIDYLQKKNMLPVIAFTLSRNRCDSNALALSTKDLNTAKDKAAVHNFFQKCILKLKPEDRNLSQVHLIKMSLERGIGIHHSGILPILKEIVEMAFQEGWVKVLFATETFAMGVNMPAKSVVFDSFKKHDGLELRILKPSEYTQMAGRAGRRRNETGTVILLCKQELPSQFELERMILGKPDLLSSKFRLRYAAILRCLCVNNIQVEDLMKHSFKEFKFKKQLATTSELLKEKEKDFSKIKNLDKNLQPLESFFDTSNKYLIIRENLMKKLIQSPNYSKEIKPGKVIIITFRNHYNKLAIVLNIKLTGMSKNTIKVLVLDNQKIEYQKENESDLWHKMVSLTKEMQFFRPLGAGGHNILEINFQHIVEITKNNIKVEPDLIIKNWEQRQIERFKDSPPSQSVLKAVAELNQLNENYISNPTSLQTVVFKKGFTFDIEEENEDLLKEYNKEKEILNSILPYTNIANFESEFKVVFDKKVLENEVHKLKFCISPESLTLYKDYSDKLKVLKELGYVDQNEVVLLKGKIACEMGQNELFIMELTYSNTFEDLEPAEIAALLSGLVFQAKTNTDYKITNEKIKEGKKRFEEIYDRIEAVENKYKLHSGLENRLNFGLIEVVYEWARDKPFSQITELTDIQEGIIVRCIQQLNETIQDVKTAATRLSNTTLKQKMEDASLAIKRDIVFAESLYTSNAR